HGYRKMRLEANCVRGTVGDEELSRVGRWIGVDARIHLAINDDLHGILQQVGVQWIELRTESNPYVAIGIRCRVLGDARRHRKADFVARYDDLRQLVADDLFVHHRADKGAVEARQHRQVNVRGIRLDVSERRCQRYGHTTGLELDSPARILAEINHRLLDRATRRWQL